MSDFRVIDTLQPVTMMALQGSRQKLLLLAAGERAFALQGFDGVSLQSVASDAGNRNKYAIQYHFKDKAGFLEAILRTRRSELNRRRQQLIDTAIERGIALELPVLLEIQFAPIAEQIGPNGETWFARLLFHLLTRLEPWSDIPLALGLDEPGNATIELWRLTNEKIAHLPAHQAQVRRSVAAWMVPGTLVDRENQIAAGQQVAPIEVWLADAIRMTAASLIC
ncbi:MAG: TetR/AcrR family transcriptional regulator [Sphingomonadales bacterium]|nr:MAG: TetR/AcrR family transcriptional regulator [Sphingomonadales bacterium]